MPLKLETRFLPCSEDEDSQDGNIAELQKQLERVVKSKHDQARKKQQAILQVLVTLICIKKYNH